MQIMHRSLYARILLLMLFVCYYLFVSLPTSAQGQTTTVEYIINANNRDAWSGDSHAGNPNHEVRINGYNSTNEPYEFVGNDSDAESAGMEFQINIPRGVTIQSASITVKAGSFQNTSSVGGMEIHMYDIANAQPFMNGFFGDLENHHPTYAQTILWNANTLWTNGSLQKTPNLSPFIQTFVNRIDYVPGNYIGFAITRGTIQAGKYYGWEDYFANGTPAKLTISYVAGTAPSPTRTSTPSVTSTASPSTTPAATQTATTIPSTTPVATATQTSLPTSTPTSGAQQIVLQVASSADDVNQENSTSLNTTGSLWLGTGQSTSASYAGLRFTNVNIPRNARIVDAYLEFYSTQSQWISLNMQMTGDDVGNSAGFTSANRPSQRSMTTQKIAYSSNTQWLSQQWYQINGLAPIVQAIVNRADWQLGNALSIILQGTGQQYSRKTVQSYDGNHLLAPRLIIKYQL